MNLLSKTTISLTITTLLLSCGNNNQKGQSKKTIAFDINQIDSSVLVCEDFEKFAVGNWLKNNPIPESESRWGSFNVLHDANELKLRTIVEEASKQQSEKGTAMQLVGDFYTSALDSNKVNELGITPIQPFLDKIDEVTNSQELVETMAEMSKYGSGSIFSYYISIDSKNSSQYITYISQGGLGLPDKSYYKPKDERGETIFAAYKKHIAALFVLAGDEQTTAEEKANSVIGIESELAANSMSRVERRDPLKTYHKLTHEELQQLCTSINWEAYFNAAELNNIETVVVRQPDYIKFLDGALKRLPIEDWKTYMKFHLINDFSSNLSIEFEQQKFSFYATVLTGTNKMKPRWKRALAKSNGTVGELIGKLFVEKHFPTTSKQKVLDLIDNISSVFKERLQELEWMGDTTKMKALDKLNKFTYKIGYPDKWKDYSSVDIQANTLVQNIMNMNSFSYKENIGKLGKPIDKTEWKMNPQRINAYYSPVMNEIVFPAAILQPPFFNPDADDAINYGGIGAVIGHEFSHGFDDQGSKYDGNGNIANWWTDEDRANFSERTNKLVDQFSAYEVIEGNHVDGQLTLGENIADIAGLTLAYYALEKAMEGKKDPMIDNYNYKQRFFLGWAQVWHTNIKDEALINKIKVDPHSPTRFRIIGPLTNMIAFQEAFGCSEGSMIAPDSLRVSIW